MDRGGGDPTVDTNAVGDRMLLTGRYGVHPTADVSAPTATNAVAPSPRATTNLAPSYPLRQNL